MNTLQNLLDNGIDLITAQSMIDNYSSKIGTRNGVYVITDIAYDFKQRGKDVTLRCTKCGKEIHRMMINGRNKWSELIKSCPCEKEAKRKAKLEKIEKNKKDQFEKFKERIGGTFGDYEIDSIDIVSGNPVYVLKCRICGAEKVVYARNFENIKNFHCTKHYTPKIKYDESYIGRKKNFLTVVGITRLPNNHRAFICECDCGNITTIEPTMWERGIVKSCGCFRESMLLEHTEELDRIRRIYSGMIQRCYNPKSTSYMNYGGRGISICEEWLNDREDFIEWALSHGYANDLSIDRINVNGNYEPSNCRWATDEVQLENRRPRNQWRKPKKRKLKTVTIDGETKSLSDWYRFYNTSDSAVRYRMKTMGMTLEEALKTPKMTDGRPKNEVTAHEFHH